MKRALKIFGIGLLLGFLVSSHFYRSKIEKVQFRAKELQIGMAGLTAVIVMQNTPEVIK